MLKLFPGRSLRVILTNTGLFVPAPLPQ